MIYLFYTVHVLTCIFLILVVLLQQGKGADLSVFGGGSTQAAFGARGAATLLHKLTVGFFILFIITTLSIAMLQGRGRSESVLSGVETEAPAAAEEGAAPATGGDTPAEATSEAPAEAPASDAPGAASASDVPVATPAESTDGDSSGESP
ncbi:MAG: preprotein translocase subunit SecG [Deltaproteobacteria bacterium]|nr:preprotein translocase subunit SecG [Deltaproteobacteria bacterium]